MSGGHDVILAVATAAGRSPRAIVRMSGASSFELLREMTQSPDDASGGFVRRGISFIRLRLGQLWCPAIALSFPGPQSYTGEDSIELQLPGNPDLLERVLGELLQGANQMLIRARHANPGEFTARAYLNGRMSLTQAEGVAATIAAQSDAELRAAHFLRTGALGDIAHSLAHDLANALALVEAGIDFTDQEDVVAITPEDLQQRLGDLRGQIDSQLKHSVGIEQLQAIPWVVLIGEPNAGKSALFNALLGRERAVVSAVSGTTRDVLTEPLTIHTDHGPAEVMLVDLAGLDDADDSPINRMMQQRAREALARAELVLRCTPASNSSRAALEGELAVRTKSDLIEQPSIAREPAAAANVFSVSAFTGAGLNELRTAITRRLADRAVSLAGESAALRPRHESSLRSAQTNLTEAIALAERSRSKRALVDPELIASAMRAALDDLAALAGDITPDEVLGRVFATFCVGK